MSSVYCYHWRDLDKIQVHDICSWGCLFVLIFLKCTAFQSRMFQSINLSEKHFLSHVLVERTLKDKIIKWSLYPDLQIYSNNSLSGDYHMHFGIYKMQQYTFLKEFNRKHFLWSLMSLFLTLHDITLGFSTRNILARITLDTIASGKWYTRYTNTNDHEYTDKDLHGFNRSWYVFSHIWRSITVYPIHVLFWNEHVRCLLSVDCCVKSLQLHATEIGCTILSNSWTSMRKMGDKLVSIASIPIKVSLVNKGIDMSIELCKPYFRSVYVVMEIKKIKITIFKVCLCCAL